MLMTVQNFDRYCASTDSIENVVVEGIVVSKEVIVHFLIFSMKQIINEINIWTSFALPRVNCEQFSVLILYIIKLGTEDLSS